MSLQGSLAMLAATNVAVVAVALWQHWPLVELLWPYWLQSVVIGWYSRRRILALRQFSLANTNGFDKGSDDATKRSTARFFVLHYGAFHLVYFVFLFNATKGGVTPLDLLFMAAAGASFVLAHRATYARIMASDAAGRPNIGGVMFLPYLRIIPMHLAILLGVGVGLGFGHAGGVLVFGTLKTAADLLMHWIEHRITSPTVESKA